jgi:hypothetical protein
VFWTWHHGTPTIEAGNSTGGGMTEAEFNSTYRFEQRVVALFDKVLPLTYTSCIR